MFFCMFWFFVIDDEHVEELYLLKHKENLKKYLSPFHSVVTIQRKHQNKRAHTQKKIIVVAFDFKIDVDLCFFPFFKKVTKFK